MYGLDMSKTSGILPLLRLRVRGGPVRPSVPVELERPRAAARPFVPVGPERPRTVEMPSVPVEPERPRTGNPFGTIVPTDFERFIRALGADIEIVVCYF